MALSEESRARFRARIHEGKAKIEHAAALVKRGAWREAERDPERADAFCAKLARRSGAERLQGPTVDYLPTPFLDEGARVSRAVGRITVSWGGATSFGTGVVVAPGVVITNQHVIRGVADASNARIEFDVEEDHRPERRAVRIFLLDPSDGFVASPEIGGLDYALMALGTQIAGPTDEALSVCPLLDSPDRHAEGMQVNIIQHPGGRPRVVALRNNVLYLRTGDALLYDTDTEMGSSGAPVFNDLWEMVALHHYGEPLLALAEPLKIEHRHLNEGVRVSAIVRDLRAQRAASSDQRAISLIDRVLDHAASVPAATARRRPQPRPLTMPAESAVSVPAIPTSESPAMSDLRINLPEGVTELSLTVRMAKAGGAPPVLSSFTAAGQPSPGVGDAEAKRRRVLKPRAEVRGVDRNYAARAGFDGGFLETMPIDLEAILRPRADRMAPLLIASTNGLLHYEHFSLAIHRGRRMAMLTATNIDGESYLKINRTTGEITPLAAEGETWYTDPRIADEYLVLQSFYSEWSHLFDRGHLTRRNDPTWGSEETAIRAETDTFHFTNCTPQHWHFNQSARHWQGLERYVLENGVHKTRAQVSVLQGPVFSKADLVADDVLLPSQFWKIATWRNPAGDPRAVALVASQQEYYEFERNKPIPSAGGSTRASEFQVPIAEVARMTGLDLSALAPWDTYGATPKVGEAMRVITEYSAIRLDPPE